MPEKRLLNVAVPRDIRDKERGLRFSPELLRDDLSRQTIRLNFQL